MVLVWTKKYLYQNILYKLCENNNNSGLSWTAASNNQCVESHKKLGSGFKSDNFVSADPYCTKGFGPDRYRYVAIEDGIATLYDSNETPKTIYNSK